MDSIKSRFARGSKAIKSDQFSNSKVLVYERSSDGTVRTTHSIFGSSTSSDVSAVQKALNQFMGGQEQPRLAPLTEADFIYTSGAKVEPPASMRTTLERKANAMSLSSNQRLLAVADSDITLFLVDPSRDSSSNDLLQKNTSTNTNYSHFANKSKLGTKRAVYDALAWNPVCINLSLYYCRFCPYFVTPNYQFIYL